MDGPRYGVANLRESPQAYLGPVVEQDEVYPSHVDGKERTAARRGLQALEAAGVVRENGSRDTYEVVADVSEADVDAFVAELEFQVAHADDF